MMGTLAFFDTNIFVYADDESSPDKQERAIRLIAEHQVSGSAVISLQVIQEYFAAATKKLRVDAELAQRLTKNAAKLVIENHSPEEYVRSLIAVYGETESARETRV